ncbi:MAG: hypothetical protein H7Y36_09935 [Armatimonadetes bacterium]|nr:hypothetical protein [Akkermansiaceae bacterium]
MRFSISNRSEFFEYDEATRGLIAISVGLARDSQWQRALDIADTIGNRTAWGDALSQIAIQEIDGGLVDDASNLVEHFVSGIRLGNTAGGREDALRRTVELLVSSRQWDDAREVAKTIVDSSKLARAQSRIVETLIGERNFDAARVVFREMQDSSARAEALLTLARHLFEKGFEPGQPGDNFTLIRLLLDARDCAREVQDMIVRAELFRSIAMAFSELYTGAVHEAFETMSEAVVALNNAPPFTFVPTPWCDTAVTFAKLGNWDMAMRIANGLVVHDVFDGCSALRDLAEVARLKADGARAETLLAEARTHALRVTMPPMQASLLAIISQEYARQGKIEEAMKDDLLTPLSKPEALDRIATVLAETGKIEEAREWIEKIPEGAGRYSGITAVVDALLVAGDPVGARAAVETITDGPERAKKLVLISSALYATGKQSEARKALEHALEFADSFRNPDSAAEFLKNVATCLVEAGDLAAAVHLVEERWLTASERPQLLRLIGITGPLMMSQPKIASEIHKSFAWVEETLLTA